jgi:hypothetical protein
MSTYKIVRFKFQPSEVDGGAAGGGRRVLKTGLTLEQVQAHCQRDDTHGGSTDDGTAWFDGYEEEK